MPKGLLLVVWSSIGLWVMGWVGLRIHSFYFAIGWFGSVVWYVGLGWVEEIGATDNSGMYSIDLRPKRRQTNLRVFGKFEDAENSEYSNEHERAALLGCLAVTSHVLRHHIIDLSVRNF